MKQSEKLGQAVTGTLRSIAQQIAGGREPDADIRVDMDTVRTVIDTWPDLPRQVAERTIQKYGPPNEATLSRLIWFRNDPWHRTTVYREEVPHKFPKPHTDWLEQVIRYAVPPDKIDDVAAFDGSVVCERTNGEVRARCDREALNFLSMNLMHDIVTGRRTVEDARQMYSETAVAFMMNRPAPYTEGFRFELPSGDTSDRDTTQISQAMLDQMGANNVIG